MIKKFRAALAAAVVAALGVFAPLPALAAEDPAPLLPIDFSQVDEDAPATLTLDYSGTLTAVDPGVAITGSAYKVARMAPGYPATAELFAQTQAVGWEESVAASLNSAGPVNWDGLAAALAGAVQADSVAPSATFTTDTTRVTLDLPVGVYLVITRSIESEGRIYSFAPALIAVPTTTPQGISYEVVAHPKGESTPKPLEPEEYKVVKHWDDASARTQRPQSVTVTVLRDGTACETVTLSPTNNWTYQWTDADSHTWSVAEKNVASAYKVATSRVANTFILTNTVKTPPPVTPPGKLTVTGFAGTYWWTVPIILAIGIALIIAARMEARRGEER